MPCDPRDVLPLKQAHYLILLALTEGDMHGYAIKKAVADRTDGAVRLGAGSLYRSLSQLQERGLIQPSEWRPDSRLDDERRVYLRLTDWGRQVASAETDRLTAILAHAQAAGLGGGSA